MASAKQTSKPIPARINKLEEINGVSSCQAYSSMRARLPRLVLSFCSLVFSTLGTGHLFFPLYEEIGAAGRMGETGCGGLMLRISAIGLCLGAGQQSHQPHATRQRYRD